MKLSLNWLRDYIEADMPPSELAHLLTMAGLEVDGMEQTGKGLDDIVAAQVMEVVPHPESDRLWVCQVDAGKDVVQVVCGAPNIRLKSMVPFAPHGATLPDGRVIKEGKFRGVMSKGMLLAEDELGLTDDHTELMILPSNPLPGTPLSAMASELSDWTFELSITPNRPDWASVVGVAREIAANTGLQLKRPVVDLKEGAVPIETLASVDVHDPKGCPRYTAGVIQQIQVERSPFWMRYRLYLSGIRSINTIVDVTNYVLLELGQPLHAFDYHRLKENRIQVRRAKEGETFVTLDNESRTLSSEALLICDAERPVALAGIMGGLNTEIIPETTDVLLESAFFDPVTIRRTSKRLGLSTESSYRFERGADIEGAPTALKRAMSLISRLAGGSIAAGIIDQYPKPYTAPGIRLRVDQTNRILGTDIAKETVAGHLKALEMKVQETDGNELRVSPPAFRVDITREIDLIEEVARLHGYDNVPVTHPNIRPVRIKDEPELRLRERMRSTMVRLGFSEIITYSFISPDSADSLGADEKSPLRSFVHILNPLSVDQSVLRTSLIPGLLGVVKNNMAHEEKDLKVFEWGKVFFQRNDNVQPHEKTVLAGAVTGLREPKTWHGQDRKVDFFDIKGAVEALMSDLGLDDVSFQKGCDSPIFDTGLSAEVYVQGLLAGRMGRIASNVMRAFDSKREDVYLFEIDIPVVLTQIPETVRFRPFSKYPAVYRDISMLIDRNIESDAIINIIKKTGGDLLESVAVYDMYEGKNLNPAEKSLSFRLSYRSREGTLDGDDINRLNESIINQIGKETGGRLREG